MSSNSTILVLVMLLAVVKRKKLTAKVCYKHKDELDHKKTKENILNLLWIIKTNDLAKKYMKTIVNTKHEQKCSQKHTK